MKIKSFTIRSFIEQMFILAYNNSPKIIFLKAFFKERVGNIDFYLYNLFSFTSFPSYLKNPIFSIFSLLLKYNSEYPKSLYSK